MWRPAFAIVIISCMVSGAASAQDIIMPDPQKIDSMTRSCVYNSAFYSQGAVIKGACLSGYPLVSPIASLNPRSFVNLAVRTGLETKPALFPLRST
jgi:hypothetical protein